MKTVTLDPTPEDQLQHHHSSVREEKRPKIEGAYRIYGVMPPGPDHAKRTYLFGRILFSNGQSHVLEDHRGFLARQFPDGPIDHSAFRRWYQLAHSPNYEVTHDTPQKQHPDPTPEQVYDLVYSDKTKQRLAVYANDTATLDGQPVTPAELERIYAGVRSNDIMLVPK